MFKASSSIFFQKKNKNPIKDRWLESSQRRQKRKAKEKPRHKQPIGTKKMKELVPLIVGSYLTHDHSNVVDMQSWDLIVMGGLE
jgi:hypothetical protein